jgi:hypothetical protein
MNANPMCKWLLSLTVDPQKEKQAKALSFCTGTGNASRSEQGGQRSFLYAAEAYRLGY